MAEAIYINSAHQRVIGRIEFKKDWLLSDPVTRMVKSVSYSFDAIDPGSNLPFS